LPKKSFTVSRTFGMRVMRRPDDLVDVGRLEARSASAFLAGIERALDQILDELSRSARVIALTRCFGPLASAVMKGRIDLGVCAS